MNTSENSMNTIEQSMTIDESHWTIHEQDENHGHIDENHWDMIGYSSQSQRQTYFKKQLHPFTDIIPVSFSSSIS